MRTENNTRVGVVGAGIMGRLLAWQLLQRGAHVTVFDRDSIQHGRAATFTAAGMLAPFSELADSEHAIFQLGLRSLQLWPEIIGSLDAQPHYCSRASLVVAHPQDARDLDRFNQALAYKQASGYGVTQLNQAQLAELEPELSQVFSRATALQPEAWLHPRAILDRLAKQCLAAGGLWYENSEVIAITPGKVSTKDKSYEFDRVFDCRGLGAKKDLPGLRGVRGELITVHAPEVNLTRLIRLMHPRYRLYLVPRENQHYLLGATQIESEDFSPISVRSTLELLSALYTLHSGFSEARIIDTRSNCRPAMPDNQPIIENEPGLTRINGLYRHGFLLAPALTEQVFSQLSYAKSHTKKTVTIKPRHTETRSPHANND